MKYLTKKEQALKVHLLTRHGLLYQATRISCNSYRPTTIRFPDSCIKDGVYTPKAWMATWKIKDADCFRCIDLEVRRVRAELFLSQRRHSRLGQRLDELQKDP